MDAVQRPLYILPQVKSRAIIPKIINLLVLGAVFYLGVLLNLSLLKIDQQTNNLIQIVSAMAIIFCILLGIIIAIIKAGRNYQFYRDRIAIGKKQILYREIKSVAGKKGFWDKLFQTYRLSLDNQMIIKNIPQTVNIADYIKKLIDYSSQQPF